MSGVEQQRKKVTYGGRFPNLIPYLYPAVWSDTRMRRRMRAHPLFSDLVAIRHGRSGPTQIWDRA